MDYSLPDIDGIDSIAAMQDISCDYNDYMDILKTYYRTLPNRVSDIIRSYEMMDITNYIIYVHGLKSSSRAIGAYKLGDMAYELEMAGKSGDIDTIRNKHDIFIEYINTLSNNLSLIFESDDLQESISEEELRLILSELKDYMNDNDIIMVNNVVEQLETLYVNDTTTQFINNIINLSLQMEYGQCIELIDNYTK